MFDLFNNNYINFNNKYLTEQIITYIGNKRALLPFLEIGINKIEKKLNKSKLKCLDGFAGSGIVSRLLKYHSSILYSNDLEKYSYIINKCYLSNNPFVDDNIIYNINSLPLKEGFITKNYAPKNDDNIQEKERVFYTNRNAMFLDTAKDFIYNNIEESKQHLYLAPLIVEASIHTNTSGVFKGFHKKNGIGHFGGCGENALTRIKSNIILKKPIFSEIECNVEVKKEDINVLIREIKDFDLVYYDPPYNQHPYGSNYFMLNILANEENPEIQDGVSGIAKNWNRSNYNKKQESIESMEDLIKNTESKYILVSYNNEGIIPFNIFKQILNKYGDVELLEQEYNTYRGCRNLRSRNIKVKELLWIIKKR